MITAYKNRELKVGAKVKVYRNLHTSNFSIKCMETGLVLAHGTDFNIINAKLIVHEAGRQRVIREKQKNVHAYVVGYYTNIVSPLKNSELYYNPYKVAGFIELERGKSIPEATNVYFTDNKCFI